MTDRANNQAQQRRRRKQTARAKRRAHRKRESGLYLPVRDACRPCFGVALDSFQPKDGLPIDVS